MSFSVLEYDKWVGSPRCNTMTTQKIGMKWEQFRISSDEFLTPYLKIVNFWDRSCLPFVFNKFM